MSKFSIATLTATAIAVLAIPATAGAYVQFNKGIAGARIGNTMDEVKTALGEPDAIKTGTNDFGPFTRFNYEGGLRVVFQGNTEVTSVSTTGRGDRTTKGIGVGSTKAQIENTHPTVDCRNDAGFRHCMKGSGNPGTRVTDFHLNSNNKVVRIVVGIVID